MRTEDVFKKILIKCLLSAGKAGIMMCLEIKAIKHLPPLLEAGHGNEAITRPLPASSQPLGGAGRGCAWPRGHSARKCLCQHPTTAWPVSRHQSPYVTYITFGHQEPNSHLARQMDWIGPKYQRRHPRPNLIFGLPKTPRPGRTCHLHSNPSAE